MATEYLYDRYNGVYWQGALYVLCQTDFVISQNGAEEYYEAYKEYITRRYCYEYDNASYKNHCEDIEKDVIVRVNKFEWDSDNDDIYS
ncbi:hypothetical protein OsI_13002 [Oryza sativa Indica Group]|uniref:Uncharacterized protein n=1 Tax=Oryza sativa subsp. indica TaxID=39946 RepID=A2XKM1_ORYSI|nr:hypothetical protein OsI_13002 [Oryza sativa Indica Group]